MPASVVRLICSVAGAMLALANPALGQRGPSTLPAGVAGSGGRSGGAGSKVELVASLGHSDSVVSVAFSPDGRRVLTGSWDHTARLWDVETGQELRRFEGHADQVTSVRFSPDGRRVLTGSWDHTARLWDAETGRELRRFWHFLGRVVSVTFSPDGRRILTGSSESTARLWDAETGQELRRFEGQAGGIGAVGFSPDGRRVLTGSDDATVRLWDVETGKELHRLVGHTSWVSAASFSPDGRRVLTGSRDKTARLWDADTGHELRRFEGHTDAVNSASFSPDGQRVLTGSFDRTARLWDVETGHEIQRFEGHALLGWNTTVPRPVRGRPTNTPTGNAWRVTSACFAPDGRRVLTGCDDKMARLWDAETGRELRRFEGRSNWVTAVGLSPDGRRVLTGSGDKTARLWDAEAGREIRRFEGHGWAVSSARLSPDGLRLLTGSGDNTARLWDAETGRVLQRFEGHSGWVSSVSFSPDGRRVLTGSDDGTARLWDVETGRELRRFEGRFWWQVTSVTFSPDGRRVLTGADGAGHLWNVDTGAELCQFEGLSGARSVSFSPDGRRLLTGHDDGKVHLWDVQTGKELRRFDGHDGSVTSVGFLPDGRRVLTGSLDKTARLWDAETGAELRRFVGHTDGVTSATVSSDGRRVLTGSADGTARLWDVESGAELCELISFDDGSWAVVDRAGRFDASNEGDIQGLHWVSGFEPIALSQLKHRYYDPGLLAKYMGLNRQPLKSVAMLEVVPLYPKVDVRPPSDGDGTFDVKLADQGGGIGRVQVLVNGKEVQADARGAGFDPAATDASLSVDLSRAASLLPGELNTVRVVGWNRDGWLSSRGMEFAFQAKGRADDRPVEWWGIVVGINDYATPALHLNYAGKDAHDMAAALRLGAARMFGGEHVHLALLSSLPGDGAVDATKDNLRAAFEDVRARAKPQDELVVYLAGHGVALPGENDQYLYLTQEAATTDPRAMADRDAMGRCSASSDELADWLRHAPPLKQVLILDTCSAGTAAARLVERREIPGEQIRAMDRLKDRTGLHVLMGCSADAVSYEASRFGQGLLTYALLQGMRGGALREDQFVDVSMMFEHAANTVPELAQGIGGIQRPEIAAPRGGGGFDIGRMEPQDKQRVPLTMARPVLLRAVLLDADLGDSLNLGAAFTRQLREASHGAGQEPGAYVFVDADEMPGAVRVSGQYTVDGATAHVKLVLTRDHKRLATLNVDGPTADPAALSEALVRAIVAELPKMPVATP